MTPLATLVRQYGWPEGLERYAWEQDPASAMQIKLEIGLRHTAWKAFLPPRSKGSALVVDGGLGSTPIALARDYSRVYAVYTDAGRRLVVTRRAAALGVHNIEFIEAADLAVLGPPPGVCDAAALVGVPPAALRPEVVDRLMAWLSPEATLYIGMENDRNIFGFLRLIRCLHNRFDSVACFRYHTTDGLPGVYEMSPFRTAGRGWTYACSTALAPFRDPALAIVASPGRGPASLIEQVLRQAHSPEDAEPLTVERYCFANPYGLTLIASGGRILRIAMSSEAIERNVTNYDALCALQSHPAVDLGSLPRPVSAGSIGSAQFFIETAVPGRLAGRLIQERHGQAVVERSIAWITRLHSATVQYQSFDDRRLRQLLLDPLDRAMNVLGAASSIPLFRDFLIHSFAGRAIPLVFSHGDYSIDNIQVDSSLQISGVFDWDLSESQGLPFLDVFYLLLTVARQRTGQPFGQLFTARLEGRSGDSTEERLVHEYCHALQLPSDLIAPLRIMAWLHHVGKRTYNPERYRFTKDAADVAGDALPAVEQWLSSRPHTPEESRYR